MLLRRLHKDQPASLPSRRRTLPGPGARFPNIPKGVRPAAIIPLLWRAQEQEGWLSRPAIEHVADMLGMAYIRALEVATFYFMFQLQPVGRWRISRSAAPRLHDLRGRGSDGGLQGADRADPACAVADGKFSWEEVECMGACANAPMAQIGKDYYEDLTAEKLRD
jgi:NADH-quinone oxidoreductase subunit E